MSNRPTSLIFQQPPNFLPPGAPLDNWEVISDTNCTYEIEASGRLIRKDRVDGARWATNELTGSFTITYVPKHSLDAHMFVLFIVCGVVNHMSPVQVREPSALLSLGWSWLLEELIVDKEALEVSKSYRGCLEIIHEAEIDPGFKTGDGKLDAMIGMALCRPALLKGKKARNALECLEDYQLRAISSWHRAHLNS